jgi:two-component system sensor histidine kinase/response regulator
MTLESVDFDLRSVVDAALEILRTRAEAKGLGLSAMYDEGVPTALRGDPTRLRQVLINLVANAVKFTERGEVVVRASLSGQTEDRAEIRLAVSDTGVGISPEALRRLFRAFAQADTSTTRKYGGTGLGLAISKRLVELMGGEIGVESEVGSGSTFWCRISFEKMRPGAAAAVKDRLLNVPVLIVDPNAASRQVLQHFALSWKMKADALAGAAKAVDLLRQAARGPDPYRLLLLDMSEDAESLATALRIKSEPSLGALRVVALTPPGKPLDAEIRRAAGIAAWAAKPVREGALFNALLEALGGGRRPEAPAGTGAKKQRFFRLLLVEDNPVNQRVAQLQLAKIGYTPDIVSSGVEALKALEEKTYDLVFMDCQMPDMDGFEATAELRRREGGERHTPIVAMTAHALEGDRERCLTAGMDDYLSKPVDIAKLGEVLARWDVTLEPAVLQGLRDLADGETKLVRDVIDQYLKDSPHRLETILKAAKEGNAKDMEKAAHSLKGSSGNIGARALWAICEKIEDLARKNDTASAAAPIGVLAEEFEKLRVELERERDK